MATQNSLDETVLEKATNLDAMLPPFFWLNFVNEPLLPRPTKNLNPNCHLVSGRLVFNRPPCTQAVQRKESAFLVMQQT